MRCLPVVLLLFGSTAAAPAEEARVPDFALRDFRGAEFRLAGPWSRSLRPEQDPLVPSFRLLENQDGAVLQLALPAELPAPLDPRQEYGLILDRTHLQDLGNHPVFTDQPNAYVPITVAPPGSG